MQKTSNTELNRFWLFIIVSKFWSSLTFLRGSYLPADAFGGYPCGLLYASILSCYWKETWKRECDCNKYIETPTIIVFLYWSNAQLSIFYDIWICPWVNNSYILGCIHFLFSQYSLNQGCGLLDIKKSLHHLPSPPQTRWF